MYSMLYGCPRGSSQPLLWAIELTECYLVHTTCNDKIIVICVLYLSNIIIKFTTMHIILRSKQWQFYLFHWKIYTKNLLQQNQNKRMSQKM